MKRKTKRRILQVVIFVLLLAIPGAYCAGAQQAYKDIHDNYVNLYDISHIDVTDTELHIYTKDGDRYVYCR